MNSQDITADELHRVFDYDLETGNLIRRVRCGKYGPGTVCGKPAASKQPYIITKLNGKKYSAHRLVWLYVNGKWPDALIDHINGDYGDNRIANLREATNSQNKCNMGAPCTNTTGLKGVSRAKQKAGYRATIKIRGKAFYLGTFANAAEAHSAYCAAAHRLHGEFAKTS